MADNKIPLRIIHLTKVPASIEQFYAMAAAGQGDAVRGRKVKFDLVKQDGELSTMFRDGVTLWLYFKERP